MRCEGARAESDVMMIVVLSSSILDLVCALRFLTSHCTFNLLMNLYLYTCIKSLGVW